MSRARYSFVELPFTSFCELPGDDHLTFVPTVFHVCHPLEVELSFIGSVLLFNTANYTFREYADMMLMYGEARRNGRAVRQLYEERFPHRPTPSHALFANFYHRTLEQCCHLSGFSAKFDGFCYAIAEKISI